MVTYKASAPPATRCRVSSGRASVSTSAQVAVDERPIAIDPGIGSDPDTVGEAEGGDADDPLHAADLVQRGTAGVAAAGAVLRVADADEEIVDRGGDGRRLSLDAGAGVRRSTADAKSHQPDRLVDVGSRERAGVVGQRSHASVLRQNHQTEIVATA